MILLAVALIAFAPGVAYLAFFYTRDKIEPEPRRVIARTFLWGMLFGLLAAILEGLTAIGPRWLQAVLLAPLIEEGAKFLAVRRTVYKSVEFDEPVDGIVYAAAAALGFASLENVGYLLHNASSSPQLLTGVFYLRGFLSVPSHALNSSLWGYALGWRKQVPELGRTFVLRWFGLAVLCHGLFNGLASLGLLGFALVSFGLIPALWRVVDRGIQRSLAASPHAAASRAAASANPADFAWKRPAFRLVVLFVGVSIVLAQVIPNAIAAQRSSRERFMESRLRIALSAAEDHAREHDGFFPSTWSVFASRLPADWWESPFGGAIDTVTLHREPQPADDFRLGSAIYFPGDLDPARRRPQSGRFYGISYRGRLLLPAGAGEP